MSSLPYRIRVDLIDNSRKVFVHVPPKDQRHITAIIAVEPLNRSEAPDIKYLHMTRNPITSALQGDGRNLCRSSVDYVQMNELEEDPSPKHKLEEEAESFVLAPHL